LDLSCWSVDADAMRALGLLADLEELTLVRCKGCLSELPQLVDAGCWPRLRRLRCVRCAGVGEHMLRELAARHRAVDVTFL
jgi:hypothetical protein